MNVTVLILLASGSPGDNGRFHVCHLRIHLDIMHDFQLFVFNRLFGTSVAQSYLYYSRYPNDWIVQKVVVSATLIMSPQFLIIGKVGLLLYVDFYRV